MSREGDQDTGWFITGPVYRRKHQTLNLVSRLKGTDSALVNWLCWMELCQEETSKKCVDIKSKNYASECKTSKPASNLKQNFKSKGRSVFIYYELADAGRNLLAPGDLLLLYPDALLQDNPPHCK